MVDHEDGGKSHHQPRRATGRGRHSAKRLLQNPGGQDREETKRILQAGYPQATHRRSTRPAGAGRQQKEGERLPGHVEGQGLEEPQEVLQKGQPGTGHPGQVQDKGGKGGAGQPQEANHRNVCQTGSRKDRGSARRTVGLLKKGTRQQQGQPSIQG